MDEPRRWILEMEPTPGEDTVKVVEIMPEDLEHHINFIDKAAAVFERTDCDFERTSVVGKVLSNCSPCYREIIHERKSPSMWQASPSS